MFDSDATLGASTTDYSTSEEITNTSGTAYTAGGATLTNADSSCFIFNAAFTDFSDVSYSSATFTANAALIYNTTNSSDRTTDAVCAIAFGSDKTATNGTFTIQFPTADATNAIIRLA